MIRSELKRTTKPLKRTPFVRTPLKPSSRKEFGGTVRIWKAARPKMTPIRKAARGEDCQIRLPMICNCNPETTVLCHSNLLEDGKGMGLKAPDTRAAFGCSACHDVIDGRAPRPAWLTYEAMLGYFEAAIERTHVILRRKGLLA